MKLKILAAAALAATSVGAMADSIDFNVDIQLSYSLLDLAPDDGQDATFTVTGGRVPVGNDFPTFFGDNFYTRFTVSPQTQLSFTGYIDSSATAESYRVGANVFTIVRGNWLGTQSSAFALTSVGIYAKTLSDHDFVPIDLTLNNDTDHVAYGIIFPYGTAAFYALGVPEVSTAAMFGLGLLGLTALRLRRNRH